MRRYLRAGALCGVLLAGTWAGLQAQQVPPVGDQPQTAPQAAAPEGEQSLGSVRISRAVLANGEKLPAGTYAVRLTTQTATSPGARGAQDNLERWVEFLQGNEVKGREVLSIVPSSEIKLVAAGAPPARGGYRVELLKGNDYVRVWIHRGDFHYLIHMPPAS